MNWKKLPIIAITLVVSPLALSAQVTDASFAIASGSTFSANGRNHEVKIANRPLPKLKTISEDLGELIDVIDQNHASSSRVLQTKLIETAINSALEQLDPHSSYYSPAEFRELNDSHNGRYFGIGIRISSFGRDGSLDTFILSVNHGSPAETAGLRFGDKIVTVDGKTVTGINSYDVRNLVRGPLDSVVTLDIEKSDGTIVRDLRLRRTRVTEGSISKGLILDGTAGYIGLTDGFDHTTHLEFDTAFRALKARGMRSIIIDLRGNGGGLMDQAILIAEKFLPYGRSIVSQRGRNPSEERSWRSRNRTPETMPLVLLVDGNTASASEILAAAMQDNDRSLIVGERTFGKGLVQNVIALEDGSGLTLTSERYYTPSGRTLQREYSDGGLYDYFRQINRGVLIDRAEHAAKTLNGRTVYGGDGIQPDIQVKGFDSNTDSTILIDALFEAIRNGDDVSTDAAISRLCTKTSIGQRCSSMTDFLRANRAHLLATKLGSSAKLLSEELMADPQVRAALLALNATVK